MKYIHLVIGLFLEMFRIFHCHLDLSSSGFPLNLFSPNLVEIVCVVSTESGSRWGERGGYKVLNGKTLLCRENAFVVDVSLLSSTKTTLVWTIIKRWSVDESKSLKRKFYFLLEGEGGAVRVGR